MQMAQNKKAVESVSGPAAFFLPDICFILQWYRPWGATAGVVSAPPIPFDDKINACCIDFVFHPMFFRGYSFVRQEKISPVSFFYRISPKTP
jgi:hypothetical protein